MTRADRQREANEAFTQRYIDARTSAVELAIKDATSPGHALDRLAAIANEPGLKPYNVNSPNNRRRLLKRMNEPARGKYEIEQAADGFAVWAAGADKKIGMPLSFHRTRAEAERQVRLFEATDNRRGN